MADFLVSELTKSVGDKTLFDKISFIIHDLDRIGLLGTNGTGKTTLLNTIAGIQGLTEMFPHLPTPKIIKLPI